MACCTLDCVLDEHVDSAGIDTSTASSAADVAVVFVAMVVVVEMIGVKYLVLACDEINDEMSEW